jgi:hypothetical protein
VSGGWLGDTKKIQLLPYTDRKLFESNNSGVKGYIGPGFFLDKKELRVRLQMPTIPSDSFAVAGGFPSFESDPDLHNFFFCSGKDPTLTIRKAAHIVLQNLHLEPAGRRTVEITGDSHHVTIDYCSVLVRTLGVVAQEGTHDLAIRNCTFQMGFPPWIAWGDVKGGSRGAGFNPAEDAGWNSFAVVGVWKSSAIERCTFFDCFDGIFLRAGSENVVVSNNRILRSRDDAIDLAPNVSNVEISDNLIWRCFEGISLVGEKGGKNAAGKKAKGEKAGEVFIHHNVIDVSARHFAERKEDAAYFSSEWSPGIAFGRHDCGSECETARWRLYNNTIVARGKTKIVPVSMPLAILSNNLVADRDDPECVLEPNPIERSDSATHAMYRPRIPMSPSEKPPQGSSAWPEFDPREVGAIR